MAKKVTIEGSNLLSSTQDAWGGQNNTSRAQTIYGTSVPPGAEWGLNRGEVERFIKSKIDETLTNIGYYTCSTAAGTAAKTVTASRYVLTFGGCIRIKMNNANTANNATLNINSKGAKALFYNGARASSSNSWEAGEVLEVYYDGTQYQCVSGSSGIFATGEKVKDTSITDEVTPNSDALPTSGAVAEETNNLLANIGFFTCDTESSTAAKVVAATGYKLTTGGNIRIKMINANTANNATLNINGTGAKALYYNGSQASSYNSWGIGDVLTVYFDGLRYIGTSASHIETVYDISTENSNAEYSLYSEKQVELLNVPGRPSSTGIITITLEGVAKEIAITENETSFANIFEFVTFLASQTYNGYTPISGGRFLYFIKNDDGLVTSRPSCNVGTTGALMSFKNVFKAASLSVFNEIPSEMHGKFDLLKYIDKNDHLYHFMVQKALSWSNSPTDWYDISYPSSVINFGVSGVRPMWYEGYIGSRNEGVVQHNFNAWSVTDYIAIKKGQTISTALYCYQGSAQLSFYTNTNEESFVESLTNSESAINLLEFEYTANTDGYIRLCSYINTANIEYGISYSITNANKFVTTDDVTAYDEDIRDLQEFDAVQETTNTSFDRRISYLESHGGGGGGGSSPNMVLDPELTFKEQVEGVQNRVIEIRDFFDLDGTTVTMGKGCTLLVAKGQLSNGTIVGNVTSIDAPMMKIFDNITFSGTWVNLNKPEWFGSVGDGVVDDAVGMNLCIAAISATNGTSRSKVMQLSGRNYYCSTTINIPWGDFTKVSIEGNGAIINSTADTVIYEGYDGGAGTYYFSVNYINNVVINGDKSNTYGIRISNGNQNLHVLNTQIMDCLNGIYTSGNTSSDILVDNCLIMYKNATGSVGSNGAGIYLGRPDNYISNTRIYGYKDGIYSNGGVICSQVHVLAVNSWNTSYNTSTSFIRGSGVAILCECYCDSQYYFAKGSFESLIVTNSYCYSWYGRAFHLFDIAKTTLLTVKNCYFKIPAGTIGISPTLKDAVNKYYVSDNRFSDVTHFDNVDDILLLGSANGTTSQRPTVNEIGYRFFDITLGFPIFWNGTKWVNSSGLQV